jgi:hypothetical protein
LQVVVFLFQNRHFSLKESDGFFLKKAIVFSICLNLSPETVFTSLLAAAAVIMSVILLRKVPAVKLFLYFLTFYFKESDSFFSKKAIVFSNSSL